MLEKNEKKCYFDAHFHYADCKKFDSFDFTKYFEVQSDAEWKGCSCACNIEEWNEQIEAENKYKKKIVYAFGIHPQKSWYDDIDENLLFLEKLILQKQINVIGEIGFDFFDKELCNHKNEQEKIWNTQLEIAIKNNIPIIIHSRKANEKLFEYSNKLKKLPGVLFHSFMGTPKEALSLCNRGINAFFSFGKQLMNNNKKSIECVKMLPIEKLLFETDAPFQKLKNQEKTYISEIKQVYHSAFLLRNGQEFDFIKKNNYFNDNDDLITNYDYKKLDDFLNQIEKNFNNLFFIN